MHENIAYERILLEIDKKEGKISGFLDRRISIAFSQLVTRTIDAPDV